MSSRRIRAYLFLLMATVIWSIAGLVIKTTVSQIKPFSFLTYRFFISLCIAILLIFIKKIKLPNKKLLLKVFGIGLLGNTVALGLLFLGVERSNVIELSIIEAMEPMVVSVLGVFFLHEVVTTKEKKGSLIAFIGTLIVILGPVISSRLLGISYSFENLIGNLFILLFVLTDGYTFILIKKVLRKKVSPMAISNLSFISGFFGILPLMFIFEGPIYFINTVTTMSFRAHLGVWYMAIISGTLAYGLWNVGQKTIEVSEASVMRYLIPVISTPLAIVLLGEELSLHFIIGAILIMVGVYIAETKPNRAHK